MPHAGREGTMPKDSQVDKKETREEKSHGQTPPTRENQNHNRNTKKQSASRTSP